MDKKRNKLNTNENNITDQIELVLPLVQRYVKNIENVSSKDLIAYFDGEAPSGDTTTINDILNNKWLLIHEIIEISELKKKGFEISADLLFTNSKEVDECHITATEYELKISSDHSDFDWIATRVKHIRSWMEDPDMLENLKTRCQKLLILYTQNELGDKLF